MRTIRVGFLLGIATLTLSSVVSASADIRPVAQGCFAPTITSVAPTSGPTSGGTSVTITGTNFFAPATVTFGGVAATNVVVVNATTITANTPPSATTGPVDVVVNTTCSFAGPGTLPNGFTYVAATVPALSPLGLAALAAVLAMVALIAIRR